MLTFTETVLFIIIFEFIETVLIFSIFAKTNRFTKS